MGFEPTTLRDLVGCTFLWPTDNQIKGVPLYCYSPCMGVIHRDDFQAGQIL